MRLLITIISFVVLTSGAIQAQNGKSLSAKVNVVATVIQSIELVTVNTIQLGSMQPGQKMVEINPVRDLNAGYMIAIGSPEAEFKLTYLSERELVQREGSGSIKFNYQVSGSTQEMQSTSELLQNDNRNIRFNGEGRYYIWVGGTVNLTNANPGTYEGDFTIEIDYI